MILLLDNFDSFTYNLVDYLAQAKVNCDVVRNDVDPNRIDYTKYSALLISPGPGIPKTAGNLYQVFEKFLDRPVLGICLGHQAIGEYFGGKLERANLPMHGKVSNITLDKDEPLFEGLPTKTDIVRYHSLIIKDVPLTINITAKSDDGEIMALRHTTLPIAGLQFHPEAALSVDGLQMLSNWARQYKLADD